MPSNGRFNIFLFAGDQIGRSGSEKPSKLLSSSYNSSKPKTATSAAIGDANKVLQSQAKHPGTVVEPYLIRTAYHLKTPITALPSPFPERQSSVFEDPSGTAHKETGVGLRSGDVVAERQDGYVGRVTAFSGEERVKRYLNNFMG